MPRAVNEGQQHEEKHKSGKGQAFSKKKTSGAEGLRIVPGDCCWDMKTWSPERRLLNMESE